MGSEHISFHSVFEFGNIEVEHETSADSRQLHVGQNLRFVDRIDFLHTFEFYDQRILDQYIHSATAVQRDSFIFDRKRCLTLMADASSPGPGKR
jgi:hypothetical protein